MATYVHHFELLASVPLSCIDGRAHRPVIGTPGGSIGELVVVLGAVESLGGTPWDPPRLDGLITALLRQVGPLYMHTDAAAAVRLAHAAGLEASDWREALDLLLHPPADRANAVLDAVIDPANVGCGHLRRLLEREGDGPRPALVAGLVRAALAASHRGEEGVVLEVLEGHHAEEEVAVFPSCTATGHGRAQPVVPRDDAAARFVYHPDAARWVRRQLCRFLEARGEVDSAPRLLEEADRLATIELQHTLDALAPDLPLRVVAPDCTAP
ncbi:MAG: hypothetical protein H6737_21010 [Alphaproteobacteria bacterium]|nr:hypothetical protein [Alphaproteobacteria bacterium]